MRLDPHHRKLRSQGGTDDWGNLLKLPREIHDLIHANPDVAYEHGMLVREHEEPGAVEPDLQGFLQAIGWEGEAEEKKPRKRTVKGTEERRKRRRISLAVPNDNENGGEVWDDTEERIKDRLVAMGLYDADSKIPAYEAWVAAANDWLNG